MSRSVKRFKKASKDVKIGQKILITTLLDFQSLSDGPNMSGSRPGGEEYIGQPTPHEVYAGVSEDLATKSVGQLGQPLVPIINSEVQECAEFKHCDMCQMPLVPYDFEDNVFLKNLDGNGNGRATLCRSCYEEYWNHVFHNGCVFWENKTNMLLNREDRVLVLLDDLVARVLAVDPVHVFIKCPYCNCVHMHGSGGDTSKDDYGNRVPHCFPPKGSYYLKCDQYTARRKRQFSHESAAKAYEKNRKGATAAELCHA